MAFEVEHHNDLSLIHHQLTPTSNFFLSFQETELPKTTLDPPDKHDVVLGGQRQKGEWFLEAKQQFDISFVFACEKPGVVRN